MFTGIIETRGKIVNVSPFGNYKRLTIKPEKTFENIVLGESVAIDGCCLTVVKYDKDSFVVEASQETLRLTIMGSYKSGSTVNLERALLPTGRLGGHIVAGHVDCFGKVAGVEKIGESVALSIRYPIEYDDYLVPKGSIAINGISLTVNEIKDDIFKANIIPFTLRETTIEKLKIGDEVNLEFDILGKYAVKLLKKTGGKAKQKSNLTVDKLIESGW